MTYTFGLFKTVFETHGIVGVLILAGHVALAVGSVLWLGFTILGAIGRWWRRRQLRRELQVLRGGRPSPLFSFYPELDDRAPRPPVRSLRRRGDDDAAA